MYKLSVFLLSKKPIILATIEFQTIYTPSFTTPSGQSEWRATIQFKVFISRTKKVIFQMFPFPGFPGQLGTLSMYMSFFTQKVYGYSMYRMFYDMTRKLNHLVFHNNVKKIVMWKWSSTKILQRFFVMVATILHGVSGVSNIITWLSCRIGTACCRLHTAGYSCWLTCLHLLLLLFVPSL